MIKLPLGESPSPDPLQKSIAAEHRRQLLLHNRERLEFAFEKALQSNLDDPVVILLDLEDERGAALARLAGLKNEQIQSWRHECQRRGTTPTQIIAAPRWAALTVIGPLSPNSPFGILKPSPPGTFRVVAIAADGNAFADLPKPPKATALPQ